MNTTNLSNEERRINSLKKIYTISDEQFLSLSDADIKKFNELLELYNLSDEEIAKLLDEEVGAIQVHLRKTYKYIEDTIQIFEPIVQRFGKDISDIDPAEMSKEELELTMGNGIEKRKLDAEKSELLKSIRDRIGNEE